MVEEEKRRAERIDDNIQANVIIEGTEYECEIHNYSETGAYLKFKAKFPAILKMHIIGQEVQIKVLESGKDKIPEKGKCIRLVNQSGVEYLAVHFPVYVDYLKQLNE